MLTVHLLGHVHVTQDGQAVVLSAKALALLVYLAAERVPQHRERLADLLWNSPEARTNLRVELARMRAAGLDLFPPSRQMLSLEHVETDVEQWLRQPQGMDQTDLATWLATLRGLPLCGLEDLGSSAFQMWVEQQRWVYCERVEAMLAQTYARYAAAGQTWATRLIAARAETIGFASVAEMEEAGIEAAAGQTTTPWQAADIGSGASGLLLPELLLPSELQAAHAAFAGVVPQERLQAAGEDAPAALLGAWQWEPGQPDFSRPAEEQVLAQVCGRAETQPQLLIISGSPGIGKSYLAEKWARRLTWESVRLTAGSSGRLMLAALAQSLLRLTDVEGTQTLWQVLLQPSSLDEDTVKVAVTLARLARPLLLIVEEADVAGTDLATLFECCLQMANEGPRLFLLLSREHPDRLPSFRRLLRRSEAVQSLVMQPLTFASMEAALGLQLWQRPGLSDEASRGLHKLASQLFQRSEGNPLHLRGLVQSLSGAEGGDHPDFGSAMLPPSVRSTLLSESEDWPGSVRDAMSRLSAVNGSFDRQTAHVVLGLSSEAAADAALYEALDRQILSEVETGVALRVSDFMPLRIAPENEVQYMFRNEALRVVLAGQLPQSLRQDVRRRLVNWVAASEPGLASYYAERAGLQEQAAQLWTRYQDQLSAGSPLLVADSAEGQILPELPVSGTLPRLVAEPPRLQPRLGASQTARLPQEYRALGYTTSLEGGWLNVMSDGRYGHPQTLHLRFEWPGALTGDLQLTWRLDVFNGGEALRPSRTPFPLRLKLLHAADHSGRERAGRLPRAGAHQDSPDWEQGDAYIFSPRVSGDFREGPISYLAQPGVVTGQWMTHRLSGLQGVTGLHLSVRALDVSLSIGQLCVADRSLLPIDLDGRATLSALDSIGSGM